MLFNGASLVMRLLGGRDGERMMLGASHCGDYAG